MLVICDAVSKSTELIAELNKQVEEKKWQKEMIETRSRKEKWE